MWATLGDRSRDEGKRAILTSKSPAHSLRRRRPSEPPGDEPVVTEEEAESEAADATAAGTEPPSFLVPTLDPGPVRPSHERGQARWPEVLVVFVVALGCAMALYHEATQAPLNTQVGGAGDADEYSWFLSWLPYALGHGLDPLISHYLNAPGGGINLMWNTSVILPSLLMTPVTLLFGAAFSYNVLVLSAPVLTVTFSYIAFRRWTGRLPALAGSLIVGFSPYIVAQSAGHLAQILIMSAPLMLILLDRILVVQNGPAWRDGFLLGLLTFAQLLTGEEVLAMEVLAAAIGVAVLVALSYRQIPVYRRYAAQAVGVAAATFAVFSAPFLAVQYLGPYRVQDVHPANAYVSDFFNFFIPTNVTKIAPASLLHISAQFTGNGSEENAYIGVPLLLFMALTLVLARRRPVTWVALGVAVGSAIISMGPTLHWKGHVTHFNLPDYYLNKFPIIHNLLPDRFASMMTVGVGLLVAVGCDELRKRRWPVMAAGWALTVAGLVALFPITDFPASASPRYSAFTSALSCPHRASGAPSGGPPVALLVPAINEMNLRWQSEGTFCFVLPSATGMTGTNSGDVQHQGVLLTLGDPYGPVTPTTPGLRIQAAQEIQQLHISEIVVGPESPTSPGWTPQGQAQAVVWVEWLLGQQPLQSHDTYISYVWKDLPPVSAIAAGHVPQVPGAPAP
jgi:hypothetical protein